MAALLSLKEKVFPQCREQMAAEVNVGERTVKTLKKPTDMRKADLKRKMLEASMKKHQGVIDDFKRRIKELKGEEEAVYYETRSPALVPYNEMVMPEIEALNEQLEFANDEMELLYKIQNQNDRPHAVAGPGAAVKTDKDTFFISASIEQFSVDGQRFIGISDQSPIYQAMRGKRKGDAFAYKNRTYRIEDIF